VRQLGVEPSELVLVLTDTARLGRGTFKLLGRGVRPCLRRGDRGPQLLQGLLFARKVARDSIERLRLPAATRSSRSSVSSDWLPRRAASHPRRAWKTVAAATPRMGMSSSIRLVARYLHGWRLATPAGC
jgi:hypothetical protein